MPQLSQTLKTLKRPRILVGAARKGAALYRRDRDLPPLLKALRGMESGGPEALLMAEAQLEQTRSSGDTGYSLARHVTLLAALIAEARLSEASA